MKAPPWEIMWGISVALFFVFKALSWNRPWRELSYSWLLLWPGMEPEPFQRRGAAKSIASGELLFAMLKTVFGALMLWAGGRWALAAAHAPWLAGWCGMIGLLFLLHFGTFHLLALFWRSRGVHVPLIMRNPPAARNLGEFWGSRWNRAFSTVARRRIFRPLAPRFGLPLATLAGFLFSGIVHELVISVPAGGWYGIPTLYFLTQGFGVLVQRKAPVLDSRWFTFLAVFAPAPWLFPPLWVGKVFVPFMHAIHAL